MTLPKGRIEKIRALAYRRGSLDDSDLQPALLDLLKAYDALTKWAERGRFSEVVCLPYREQRADALAHHVFKIVEPSPAGDGELLPCPFCGSPGDYLATGSVSHPDVIVHRVMCSALRENGGCAPHPFTGWFATKEEAFATWNRRQPLTRQGGKTEQAPSIADFVRAQAEWSAHTFGPGPRSKGNIDHIRKELAEIEANPSDVVEWCDVATLALDGAQREGHSPESIAAAMFAKLEKNKGRQWPDWRTHDPDKGVEHIRDATPSPAPPVEDDDAVKEWEERPLVDYDEWSKRGDRLVSRIREQSEAIRILAGSWSTACDRAEAAEASIARVTGYLTRLLKAIWPEANPTDNAMNLVDQIDNWIVGLRREKEAAERERDALSTDLEKVQRELDADYARLSAAEAQCGMMAGVVKAARPIGPKSGMALVAHEQFGGTEYWTLSQKHKAHLDAALDALDALPSSTKPDGGEA